MKTKWKHLIAGLTMFVLCISVCTTTANATVIWEDNFDDLDDWTIFGYENKTSPVEIGGNFSAASGMLTALDDDFNVARHESTTNVGTWSFDMFVPDDDDGYGFFCVDFMSNGAEFREIGNASILGVGASYGASYDRFYIVEGLGSSFHDFRFYTPDVLQGWHHIDVSRTSDCRFRVYFNGTLRLDFFYTAIDSSTYLSVVSYNVTGAAIDNLVVRDTNYTTSTTTTAAPLPWVPIAIGGGVAAAVIVLVIVFVKRR